jgi:hypothetical protein
MLVAFKFCWPCIPLQILLTVRLVTNFVDRASRYRFCWPCVSLQILLTVHLVINFVDRAYRYKFCWPCISLQILSNDQLNTLSRVFIYFISQHVSSITMLIIRRSNCMNTSSGMISLCKWLLGMPVGSFLLTGIPSSHSHRLIIPDDVLIQFDLPMMSMWCSTYVERWNK